MATPETQSTGTQKWVNGVNVTALMSTIGAIRDDGSLANFQFRAKNRWINGGHNQSMISEYHGANQDMRRNRPFSYEADEPPVLLGQDLGANPVEFLLTALSACMTTSLVYHAASRGIKVEQVESELEGDIDMRGFMDLDPNTRKGYREIRARFRVKSDADEKMLEELLKKSPVFDVVTNPTPVRISVEKITS